MPVEDFMQVQLPDFDGECRLVWQLCVVAAIGWLFVLPPLFSRPMDLETPPTTTNVTNKTSITSSKKVKGPETTVETTPNPQPVTARYIPLYVSFVSLLGCLTTTLLINFHWSPYNYFTPRRIFQAPLLTPAECQIIVDMANRAAERNVAALPDNATLDTSHDGYDTHPLLVEPRGWQKTRHGSYPTTDLNLVTDPFTPQDRDWLADLLDRRLAPSLQRFFGVPPASIRTNDLFVVRYDADKRAHLANHTDDGDISFNILLTTDFDGGGTQFWRQHKAWAHVAPTTPGTFLTHSAQLWHEGYQVSRGTRIILVGFTNVDRFDPFSDPPQPTGLSWMASWGSFAWTHIRFRAGYYLNLLRLNEGWDRKTIYNHQWVRLLFRDLINILEMVMEEYCTYAWTNVVNPDNATAYLQALDDEYAARGQYLPKANWFKGQNVDLEVVRWFVVVSRGSEVVNLSGTQFDGPFLTNFCVSWFSQSSSGRYPSSQMENKG